MNWFKKSQLKETLPYFQEFEEYGDYIPDEESLNSRLKAIGISIVSDIGSGDSGVAYLLSNGDVLKITTNHQEGKVSMHLLNNPHPSIVEYKKVWKEGDLYYIIMEHIDKVVSDIPELRDSFIKFNEITDKLGCYDPYCSYEILLEQNIFQSKQLENIVKEYLFYLKTIPIKIYDFINPNNIGIKDGVIKFFDIT